jgi:hypothetical protein
MAGGRLDGAQRRKRRHAGASRAVLCMSIAHACHEKVSIVKGSDYAHVGFTDKFWT